MTGAARLFAFVAALVVGGAAIALALWGDGETSESVGPERVDYGDDPAQYGWLRIPAGEPAPVVVLIHGGFWSEPWDYTLMEDLANALQDEGIATWNIEFRRLRGRGGWPNTFVDVRTAVDHLAAIGEEWPLDTDRVVAVGHSSGGHLAMWLTRTDTHRIVDMPTGSIEVAAAVGIAPLIDLRATPSAAVLLGGGPDEVPSRWADAAVGLDPGRVRIVHGEQDDIVPISEMTEKASADGVRVVRLPGTDHFEPITGGEPAFAQVVEEILEAVASTGW